MVATSSAIRGTESVTFKAQSLENCNNNSMNNCNTDVEADRENNESICLTILAMTTTRRQSDEPQGQSAVLLDC